MMSESKSEQWGIVEIMGHSKYAGLLSQTEMFGAAMLRVDVPGVGDSPAFTKIFGDSAIFSITFTSEELARLTAEAIKSPPVNVYAPDLNSLIRERYKQLPHGEDRYDPYDEDDEIF